MKVSIIGTHGIPPCYGGFETFALELAKRLTAAGISVTVVNEKDNPVSENEYGINVITSSYNKSDSPMEFYRDSIKLAENSDVIISCGVGGSYYYSKISRQVIIITNIDGLEHLRRRYTLLQRWGVYFLQKLAAKKSHYIVADSQVVKQYWDARYPRYAGKSRMIAYGADKPYDFNPAVLKNYGVEKDGYFLIIARLVEENNIREIVKAFEKYIGEKKLIITGGITKDNYVTRLLKHASPKIIFTDSIYEKEKLDSLRQGCFAYIHGHSVGGTNPSLLEALAAGCACICHDNPFNREVTGNSQLYFHSHFDLGIMLNLLEHKKTDMNIIRSKASDQITQEYSWDYICHSYMQLFKLKK